MFGTNTVVGNAKVLWGKLGVREIMIVVYIKAKVPYSTTKHRNVITCFR
jgi:hypothetical protein